MAIHDPMPLSAAADALGVSPERVRALIAAGELPAVRVGARWIVERAAVDARQRAAVPAGRPWSSRAAWGAIAMLERRPAPWLPSRMRARIERRLAASDLHPVELRRRADRFVYRAHPALLPGLMSDAAVVVSGVRAAADAGLDLVGSAASDAVMSEVYVRAEALDRFAAEHHLFAGVSDANLVVRAIRDVWPFGRGARVAPGAAVALDLLESDDGRAQRVGLEYFQQRLTQWST